MVIIVDVRKTYFNRGNIKPLIFFLGNEEAIELASELVYNELGIMSDPKEIS